MGVPPAALAEAGEPLVPRPPVPVEDPAHLVDVRRGRLEVKLTVYSTWVRFLYYTVFHPIIRHISSNVLGIFRPAGGPVLQLPTVRASPLGHTQLQNIKPKNIYE